MTTRHHPPAAKRVGIRALLLVALAPVALGACSDDESPATAETVVIPAPTGDGSTSLSANVVFLDVRSPEEYAEGHLEGAVNINVEDPSFADEISALDKDVHYIVYCRSGRRSAVAVQAMEDAGFTNVTDAGAIDQAAAYFELPIVAS